MSAVTEWACSGATAGVLFSTGLAWWIMTPGRSKYRVSPLHRWHDWTLWESTTVKLDTGMFQEYQHRRCVKCNKVQYQRVLP
jgi:hypothetical protein